MVCSNRDPNKVYMLQAINISKIFFFIPKSTVPSFLLAVYWLEKLGWLFWGVSHNLGSLVAPGSPPIWQENTLGLILRVHPVSPAAYLLSDLIRCCGLKWTLIALPELQTQRQNHPLAVPPGVLTGISGSARPLPVCWFRLFQCDRISEVWVFDAPRHR